MKQFYKGDRIKANGRVYSIADVNLFDNMREAKENGDEDALTELMNRGQLIILNCGQQGEVIYSDGIKSQIKTYGNYFSWVSTAHLSLI